MSIDDLLHAHRDPIVKTLDAAVSVAALATIPIVFFQLEGEQSTALAVADWATWLVFVIEYVVMLLLPPGRGGFDGATLYDRRNWRDWKNWVSLAIIVLSFPPLYPIVRIARVVRLARLGRIGLVSARAIGQTVGRSGVLYVAGFVVFAIIACGFAIASLEPDLISDWKTGIWWAAFTTVGTGISDPEPATPGGRAIALGLMLCGVALVTTLAGSVAAYFLGDRAHVRLDSSDTSRSVAPGVDRSQETPPADESGGQTNP